MILTLLLAAASPMQADYRSPTAARGVVETYYAAIDRGRYATAWRLWARGGQASGKTLRAFTAGFAKTRATRVVTYAPVDQEGAAGSVFITVPVRVDATLKDGTRQRFAGSYVLRRVNNVDGATFDQRHWRIDSARLRTTR